MEGVGVPTQKPYQHVLPNSRNQNRPVVFGICSCYLHLLMVDILGGGRVDSLKGMHIRNKNKQTKTLIILNSTYKMI